jgi:predicted pyridoxine 5'-phosphate oxidase superfamily flavin-nucleotide-binding protein
VFALTAPLVLSASHPGRQELSLDSVLQATREMMAAAEYCFLITLDASGQPQARLMDPFQPEQDLTVWMGTSSVTRKVKQIRNDPRATLAYYDAAGYLLIEFTPARVEAMSMARNVGTGAFAPAILEREGSSWVLR